MGIMYAAPIEPKVRIGKAGVCAACIFVKVLLAQVRARFVRFVKNLDGLIQINVVENYFVIGIAVTALHAALGHWGFGLRATDFTTQTFKK
jgi:hypothetical protein